MDGRVVRRLHRQVAIGGQRVVEIADGQALIGEQELELRYVGPLGPQVPGLLERLLELLALVQDVHIVDLGAGIVRLQHQGGFQEELRLVIGVEGGTDLRQEAHGLHMVTVGLQEAAAQGFRLQIAAFPDQVGDAQQFRRQAAQIVVLVPGKFRGGRVAGGGMHLRQHLPAGGQGRIVGHRLLVGGEGTGAVPHLPQAMGALLVGPAKLGLEGDQRVTRRDRLQILLLIVVRHGQHVERFPVAGLGVENAMAEFDGLGEL